MLLLLLFEVVTVPHDAIQGDAEPDANFPRFAEPVRGLVGHILPEHVNITIKTCVRGGDLRGWREARIHRRMEGKKARPSRPDSQF